MGTYSDLGKRIERLLYFGAILLLLCTALDYFVTTASYVTSQNPYAFGVLAQNLAAKQTHLQELYGQPVNRESSGDKAREQEVQSTRKSLGMKPEIFRDEKASTETYANALSEIVTETSIQTGMDQSVLIHTIDAQKSPLEVIATVEDEENKLIQKPVKIWGIETPQIVPLEYGKAHYEVPAPVIANFLTTALGPLILWWFGALILTRQRELLFLRASSDFKVAFPHVLNLLPVNYTDVPWREKSYATFMRNSINSPKALRITYAVGRSIILLLFCGPTAIMYIYSALRLFDLHTDANWLVYTVAALSAFFIAFSLLMINIQDWLFLRGKVYSVAWE